LDPIASAGALNSKLPSYSIFLPPSFYTSSGTPLFFTKIAAN